MTAAQWQEVLCRVRSLSAADKDRLLTYLYALHDKPQQPMNTESTPETQPYTASSSETMKAVRELHLSILNAPSPIEVDGVYRVMLDLTALWNAGRVQGIREERARRKRKAQTIKQ